MGTVREQLAAELKKARLTAGFDSQAKLAKAMVLSRPVVVKAESPNGPVPSDPVLAAWSKVTGADLSMLAGLAKRARSSIPEWFADYRGIEQEATAIRLWQPLAVHGLFQTADYARALLSARRRTPDQVQALVDQRLERQQVIGRCDLTAVIDYAVIQRCIGSPAIMVDQCRRLAELVERYAVSLHIVPPMANIGLTAPFTIATKGTVSTVCLTASSRDITSTAPDVIAENASLFDAVLGASMPVVQSLEYVRQWEAKWKEKV